MPDLVGVAPRCKLNAKLKLFYRALDSFDGADRLRANMGALLTVLAVSEGWARVEVEYKKCPQTLTTNVCSWMSRTAIREPVYKKK